ncbi:MAG: hypothetical protein WCB12_08600 [Bryobacteraceae bacterium]
MVLTKFPALLGFFLAMVPPGVAFAGQLKSVAAASYPANYEGGTLPLQHSKVKATLGAHEVILVQHGHRIAVPASSITGIACATGVHRRLGAAVLDVVPRMHLGETEDHYVGVTWLNNARTGGRTPKVEVLFRLNKSEYRNFLSGLERLTGKTAVDTNRMLTTVHYDY